MHGSGRAVASAWALAVGVAITIFLTIPLARDLQRVVNDTLGRAMFTNIVLAAGAIGCALAAIRIRRARTTSRSGYGWLAATAVVFVGYTWSLSDSPEESVHFVEYGALAVALFAALRHHVQDATIYVTTIAMGASVGTIDEAIQWVVPGRFWDLRDIGFNAMGVTLVVVAIALGIRPKFVTWRLTQAGVRWATTTIAVGTVLLGASLLNTPERIAAYSTKIPGLAFVADTQMIEYGYRYEDAEIGVFRSRFAPAELARADEARAEDAAKILDDYYDGSRYGAFLSDYPSSKDAFVHEARVHLFRRGHYHRTGSKLAVGDDERRRRMGIVFRENQIMSKYFPKTLARSKFAMTDREVEAIRREAKLTESYESPVSRGLFTRIGETTVAMAMVVILAALALLRWRLGVVVATVMIACAAPPSAPADTPDLTLLFYTDVHTRTEYETPRALSLAAEQINAVDADLLIAGGDVITDGFQSQAAAVEPRWDTYLEMVRKIEGHVHHVIGNHDLVAADPDDGSVAAPDPRAMWRDKTGEKRTYRSFDMRGYHFIFLDSIQVGGPLRYRGFVGGEQMAWLAEDLRRVERGTPIVLATHIPLMTSFYQATVSSTAAAPVNRVVVNSREVLEQFRDHDLILVLQGHQHASESIVWRGTTFLTGGALSAKWWRGPWHGTEEGFTVVRLRGRRVDWHYVDIGWEAKRPGKG